jgi:outer membrane protein
MSKRPRLLLLIFMLSYVVPVIAQDQWNLKQCVEYAIANNISVKQADIQARMTKLQLRQAELTQYPTASLSNNTGLSNGRSIDPTSNQFTNQQLLFSQFSFSTGFTIFNWFATKNNVAGNQYDYEAAKATVDKIKNDISLNVATAYLLVLLAKEQVSVAKVAIQQSKQNLDNTRKRVNAGLLPELNALEVEAQLARDTANFISQQATVEQNILQLKAVMNVDAAAVFDIVLPPLEKIPIQSMADLQPEAVYILAMANLPLQRVNDLKIKAAEKYSKAAKAALLPSIAGFGSMASNYANNKIPSFTQIPTGIYQSTPAKVNVGGIDYQVLTPGFNNSVTTTRTPLGKQLSDNFRQQVGINVSIPIFNAGTAHTAWEKSKLTQQNLSLQQQQDNQKLKQDIYLAYTNAITSMQKYQASKKTLATAEQSFNFAQKRYDVGLLPTIDLLTNQNNLTKAKVEVIAAQADYVFKMKVLEFYKGQGLTL